MSEKYKWKEEDENSSYSGPYVNIPDDIKDVDSEITKQILKCEISGKLYKIIPQELECYKTMGIPIPRCSPEQRWKDRFSKQNLEHFGIENVRIVQKELKALILRIDLKKFIVRCAI